jgi:hypothetical protein
LIVEDLDSIDFSISDSCNSCKLCREKRNAVTQNQSFGMLIFDAWVIIAAMSCSGRLVLIAKLLGSCLIHALLLLLAFKMVIDFVVDADTFVRAVFLTFSFHSRCYASFFALDEYHPDEACISLSS